MNRRNRKYVARNTIIDKTIDKTKEEKARDKKQKQKNRKHIVEQSILCFERDIF